MKVSSILVSAVVAALSLTIYLAYRVTSSSSPETLHATTVPVDPALAQAERRIAQLQRELAVLRNERDLFREQFYALQQQVQLQQKVQQQQVQQQQATPVVTVNE